tara:strand:+ start:234 stop:428 length:195 start_codon:yes stop_codon:yes gene_type:complete
MFNLQFDTDNDAFIACPIEAKVEAILTLVANDVSAGEESGAIRDINGNTIGHWSLDVETKAEGS